MKAHLRSREFFRIQSVIETGAESGMWTWERYRQWMSKRSQWFLPDAAVEAPDSEGAELVSSTAVPALARARTGAAPPSAGKPASTGAAASGEEGRRIEIEPTEGGIENLLRRLK